MQRRIVYLLALLAASWCVMTFTHEAGHIVGGWVGGARLRYAQLWPWGIPYSTFDPDPHPLLTVWSGPLLGALVPVGVALLVRRRWAWFIAHFCLLANGTYLVGGWITGDRLVDTTRLLAAGAHPATIVAYCLLTVGVGYVGFRRSCVQLLSPRGP